MGTDRENIVPGNLCIISKMLKSFLIFLIIVTMIILKLNEVWPLEKDSVTFLRPSWLLKLKKTSITALQILKFLILKEGLLHFSTLLKLLMLLRLHHFPTVVKVFNTEIGHHHCLQAFNTEKGFRHFLTTSKVINAEKGLPHFLTTLKVFNSEKGHHHCLKVFNTEKERHHFLMTIKVFDTKNRRHDFLTAFKVFNTEKHSNTSLELTKVLILKTDSITFLWLLKFFKIAIL